MTDPRVFPLQDILIGAVKGGSGHAFAAGSLMSRQAARLMHNSLLSLRSSPQLLQPGFWLQALEMHQATQARMQQQQQRWAQGCASLMQDYARIPQANTVSKLVEKQYNLMAQWMQLLGDSTTGFINLMENIEVAYGYWASGEGAAAR